MAAAASAGTTFRASSGWCIRPAIVRHLLRECGASSGAPTNRGCPGLLNATQRSLEGRPEEEAPGPARAAGLRRASAESGNLRPGDGGGAFDHLAELGIGGVPVPP